MAAPPAAGKLDAQRLAALLGMSAADVRSLTRSGVITSTDGLYDSASSLLAISRHLVKTRDVAEAKARAAEADAKLKESRLKAAVKREEAAASISAEADANAPVVMASGRKAKKRTAALENQICEGLASGLSLTKACAGQINSTQVMRWVKECVDFARKYAQAREIGWLSKVDRILDLCEALHEAARDPECGQQRIAAIKTEIDTLKWLLCKTLPKIYGERAQVEVQTRDAGAQEGTGGGLTPEEADNLCAAIAARQAALQLKLEAEMAEAEAGARPESIG